MVHTQRNGRENRMKTRLKGFDIGTDKKEKGCGCETKNQPASLLYRKTRPFTIPSLKDLTSGRHTNLPFLYEACSDRAKLTYSLAPRHT